MGIMERFERPNVLTDSFDYAINWARKSSLWWLLFGIKCCAIEMMMVTSSRYDFDRFGIIPRGTPRQADVMVVAGPISYKMKPVIVKLYHQMAEPRWVISMGSCANSGGAFRDSYNIIDGVDKIIPVDLYIPGCPPRPESLLYGITKLQETIMTESSTKKGR